jgi:Pro-kumamolisin, activation domain
MSKIQSLWPLGQRSTKWLVRGMALATVALVASSCTTHEGSDATDHGEKGPAAIAATKAKIVDLVTPAPQIGTFVLYAERSVTLDDSDIVSFGDVGVHSVAAATFGAQIAVGAFSEVAGNLWAPSVSLGLDAQVGKVQTNALQNNGGFSGTVTAFDPTVMPPTPLATPPASSGPNVSVASGQTKTLTPGAYGELTVSGVLVLAPGAYSFADVTLAPQAQLLSNAGVVSIQVAGRLTTGQGSIIEGSVADELAVSVSGNDGATGTSAVTIGPNSLIAGLVVAPHGTISFGNAVVATGAFAAFDIRVGQDCVVTFQTGLSASAQGQQALSGYVTPPIAGAPVVGPVPQSTVINLAIGLPVQDPAALATTVQQLSDPTSPTFRQFLTETSFEATFSPTLSNYQQLLTWAQSVGFVVTEQYPNRLLLDVTGTVGQIESALFTNMVLRLRPDGTQFFSLAQEPSVQLTPLDPILRISGLDNRVLATPGGGTAPLGFYGSNDVRGAYASCTTANGSGQSVGLFELDGFTASDITLYECNTNLATCNNGAIVSGTVPNVQVVTVDGFSGNPSNVANSVGEVTGDTELAIAMAPGLSNVYVFEAQNNGSVAQHNDILNKMASTSGLNQLSSSWFFGVDQNTQPILYALGALGRTFFQCAGDQGSSSFGSDPGDIRDEDAVTVTGGTTLTLGSASTYSSETTWNINGQGAGGGGIASNATIPVFQSSIGMSTNGGSTTKRNLPDVSLVATGLYVVVGGNQGGFLGTSAAAPLWAGYTALANQLSQAAGTGTVGPINPFLSSVGEATPAIYNGSFNDISDNSTNAGSCQGGPSASSVCTGTWTPATSGNYTAVTGYDLATGWGTPKCAILNEMATGTLVLPPPDAGVDAGEDSGSTSPTGCGGPLTISATATEGGQGCEICLTGQGFTPGGVVQVVYLDAPVFGGTDINSIDIPVVAADCSMGSQDSTFGGGPDSEYGFDGNGVACTSSEAAKNLTIQATDMSTGRVATTTIPEGFICGTEPPTGTGTAACPLPPE